MGDGISMTDWQRKIDIHELWKQREDDENSVTLQQLAGEIARQLKGLTPFRAPNEYLNDKRNELAEEFEDMAESTDVDVEDFDYLLSALYDWGDIKISGGFFDAKTVCWIRTAF